MTSELILSLEIKLLVDNGATPMLIPQTSPSDTSQTKEAANARATPASAATKSIAPAPGSASADSAMKADTFMPSMAAPDSSELSIDKVSLSAGLSGVRADKIQALRAQISAGTYLPSASDVAQAMMRKGMFNTKVQ